MFDVLTWIPSFCHGLGFCGFFCNVFHLRLGWIDIVDAFHSHHGCYIGSVGAVVSQPDSHYKEVPSNHHEYSIAAFAASAYVQCLFLFLYPSHEGVSAQCLLNELATFIHYNTKRCLFFLLGCISLKLQVQLNYPISKIKGYKN